VIKKILKALIPIIVVAAGVYGAWKMIESRPVVETAAPEKIVPLVRALEVQPRDIEMSIHSQGTVTARTVTELIPEVSGKVIWVSPSIAAGGFFEAEAVLLQIDDRDYELALKRAEAEMAQAGLRLVQEEAEAEVAEREWAELGDEETPSDLVLRKPQVAQARAALEAAKAAVEQAKRDLAKTRVTAPPFDGRVRQESVDVGQYVSRGVAVAQLYSVDVAEVRLPLSNEDLAYANIPLSFRDEEDSKDGGPKVFLKALWAGREYVWEARIVRTEGEIDPNTRMIYAVAQVEDPYAHGDDPNRPPLAVGMFVEAEILGKPKFGVVVLPRAAIRGSNTVYVIDEESRLRFRLVEVFRQEREQVIIESGLKANELVCISPMETVVDGMEVQFNRQEAEP
jgi:RND family efflux transporter MFP subunit